MAGTREASLSLSRTALGMLRELADGGSGPAEEMIRVVLNEINSALCQCQRRAGSGRIKLHAGAMQEPRRARRAARPG